MNHEEKIAELIAHATTEANRTQTRVVIEYADDTNVYALDKYQARHLIEDRDIHITVAAEPKS